MHDHLIWLTFAAFVVGLGKGGLTATAALAVPLLALFMNPVAAAALLLPIFIVTDWFAVWIYRRDHSARNIAILVPSILAGILVATLIVSFTPEALLLVLTGTVGLWAVTRSWFSRSDAVAPKSPAVGPGVFWGVVAGITTFITHSGAPPTQAYLLPQKLPRLVFAGTVAITFAIGNVAKIPGYYELGYFEGIDWALLGVLTVAGLFGTVAGRWAIKRLSDNSYLRVVEGLLLVLSLAILWRAWALIAAG